MDEARASRDKRRPPHSARPVGQWADAAVAAVLVALFWVPALLSAQQAGFVALGVCLAACSATAVVLRWRLPSAAPVTALAVTGAGWMLQLSADPMLAVAWCLYPMALRRAGRTRIIGAAAVSTMALFSLTHGAPLPAAVDQPIVFSAIVIGAVWLLGQAEAQRLDAVRESADRRAAYEREVQKASMAREVHDVVGHALSVISAEAEVSRSLNLGEADLREALGDIEQRARGALEEAQQLVRSLRQGEVGPDRATPLPQLLVAARVSGLDVRSRLDVVGLPGELSAIISRVVQESLSNIVRHAEATRCEVAVWREGAGVTIRVDDDGIGLPAHYRPGMGLTGMRERVGAAGGSMTVATRLKGGTRVLVTMPIGAST